GRSGSGCSKQHTTGPRAESACRAVTCRVQLLRAQPYPSSRSRFGYSSCCCSSSTCSPWFRRRRSWRRESCPGGEAIVQQIYKRVLAIFASIAGLAFGVHAAFAQDVPAPSEYQFFVTPYLWLSSVHATTLTPLDRVPQVNSNVSTIDLLSHLHGV